MKTLFRELFVENPMAIEATRMRRGVFMRGAGVARGFAPVVLGMILLIYVWLIAAEMQSKDDWTVAYLIIEFVVLTLVIPMSIFSAVAGERERASWEALILTRLTPAQIIVGKLSSRVLLALAIIAFFSPLMVVGHLAAETGFDSTPYPISSGLTAQAMILGWSALVVTFGLWISASSRRGITAVAVIYGTLLTCLALVPLLLSMLQLSGPENSDAYLWTNPLFVLSKMPDGSNNPGTSVTMWGLPQTLLYAGLAVVLIFLTYIRLKRLEEPQKR